MNWHARRSGKVLLFLAWLLAMLFLRVDAQKVAAEPSITTVIFRGHVMLVRTVDPKAEDLRLYWRRQPIRQFMISPRWKSG